MALSDQLLGALGRIARDVLRTAIRERTRPTRTPRRTPSTPRSTPSTRPRGQAAPTASPPLSERYPGDYRGMPEVTYAPFPGNLPDPGEVVWTWVPYEEDHSRGKDRPVLLVGRDGDWLLGLPLTSEDHDADAAQEAAAGRYWLDIGRGAWDPQGRPSEVRLNRVVRVDPDRVRRVSVHVPESTFKAVEAGMRRHLR